MLDNDVINLADRQIQLACEEQDKNLAIKMRTIRADASRRGMGGNYINAVQEACATATTERGEFVWNILFRCITTVGFSYDADIELQLKSAVDKHFPEHMNGLKYHVQEAANTIRMSDIVSKIPDEIGNARLAILRKIHTEIELFLMKLKATPAEIPYAPPQININNSTIGALQTASGAIANVSQQIDCKAVQAIISSLTLLAKELTSIETLPQNEKSEIVELVNDGIVELSKEKPNLSKIKSFISTIGSAISFTANLKPAYDTLKVAVAMIGLTLP